MSITRLPEIVFPLTQVNKVNEIVDVLNDNLNMYYSSTNPALTPVDGVATWVVTHNLGTENVNCSLYNGDNLVISNVSITSDNVITVSFNATTNIAQDTYKIVVISNGAGSSSGSGSYVLPTASTTTLGGVRIDGSSITINNGVISSSVDSTLSSTSTNPVQNKVLYPSLSKFLPDGTIITVKSDGTGDYTKLSDAVNSLTGKWSDGQIYIDVYGTIVENSTINIYGRSFNFSYLWIRAGESNAKVQFTNTGTGINIGHNARVHILSLNFENTNGTTSNNYHLISAGNFSDAVINGCTLTGGNVIVSVGDLILVGNIVINNTRYAVQADTNGRVSYTVSGTLTSNANTLLYVHLGGYISIIDTVSKNFTGSTISNGTRGTYNANGYVVYPSTW